MLRNVFNLEESSTLSDTVAVGGGVEISGTEIVELAADGAGEGRSMVDPDEAYAMLISASEDG